MKSNYRCFAILAFALAVSGCAGRAMEPKVQSEEPEKVERAIEVEEDSLSDYSVRAGHWAVETGEGISEAAEDGWEWMREKKNRAKGWVHENTKPDK